MTVEAKKELIEINLKEAIKNFEKNGIDLNYLNDLIYEVGRFHKNNVNRIFEKILKEK